MPRLIVPPLFETVTTNIIAPDLNYFFPGIPLATASTFQFSLKNSHCDLDLLENKKAPDDGALNL
jgi:hypothetical protein